jgi:hypothetical protein
MNLDLARRSSAAVGSASSEKEARGDKPKSSKEELGGVVNRDVAWWMMAGRTSRLDLNATTDVHWTWITGSVSRPSSGLGDGLLLFFLNLFSQADILIVAQNSLVHEPIGSCLGVLSTEICQKPKNQTSIE